MNSDHTLIRLKQLNSMLNSLEALMGVSEMRSVPGHLEIDFSSQCNLRCPMCHQAKLDMGKFQLGSLDLDTLIDSLPYRESVMIAGLGEPLLYRGLPDFLPYLRRYRCHSHLFTNGQLIDKHLSLLHCLDRISVSFDGATPATFETLRRGASFAKVTDNVRRLREAAPRTTLVTSTVVSNRNVPEIADLAVLAQQLGFEEVHLSPVDHTPALALGAQHQTAFSRQLQLARERTRGSGLRIFNHIFAQHFSATRNGQISSADQLASQTASPPVWPEPEMADAAVLPSHREGIHHLSAEAQEQELNRRANELAQALSQLRPQLRNQHAPLAMPFCSAPWKYAFARSNGQARLCPYADLDAGPVNEVLGQCYNSAFLVSVRDGLGKAKPTLSVCQGCTDDHRHFKQDQLQNRLRQELVVRRVPQWLPEGLRALIAENSVL
jgi:pyruvate-formate lyase-activating enzyme